MKLEFNIDAMCCTNPTTNNNSFIAKCYGIKESDIVNAVYKTVNTSEGREYQLQSVTVKG
jgi:hypothetical protein